MICLAWTVLATPWRDQGISFQKWKLWALLENPKIWVILSLYFLDTNSWQKLSIILPLKTGHALLSSLQSPVNSLLSHASVCLPAWPSSGFWVCKPWLIALLCSNHFWPEWWSQVIRNSSPFVRNNMFLLLQQRAMDKRSSAGSCGYARHSEAWLIHYTYAYPLQTGQMHTFYNRYLLFT